MKYSFLYPLCLLASISTTSAVTIDIAGAVQGTGEFADYGTLGNQVAITPNSVESESGFTLTTVFSGGTTNNDVNWSGSYTGGLTYDTGQEINFRAGGDADNGSSTRVIGDNYFDIVLDGDSTFNWDSISVQLWRNGTGASEYYQFAYDDEGNGTYGADDFLGTATQVANTGVTVLTPNQLATIAYSGAVQPMPTNVTDVAGATIRLYFWGATSNGGNTHLINVSADYSPIPEPATYALVAGALGLGLVILRRRR